MKEGRMPRQKALLPSHSSRKHSSPDDGQRLKTQAISTVICHRQNPLESRAMNLKRSDF
jgi:hypothetical protein